MKLHVEIEGSEDESRRSERGVVATAAMSIEKTSQVRMSNRATKQL